MNQLHNYTDEALLDCIRNGDKSAFDEVYNRHWSRLYIKAVKVLKSEEEAQEIIQDLFLNLWLRRENLKILNLFQYLNGAVQKKIVDSIRSKIVEEKYWRYYKAFVPQSADETESAVSFNELNHELKEAIAQLPEKSQLVFNLNRIEGRSVSEIAKVMKVSERAIEYHITKSLKYLRSHLKDFVFFIFLLANK